MIRRAALIVLLLAAALAQAGEAPPPLSRTETIPAATFTEDFGVVLPGQMLSITVVAAPGYALDEGEVDKASGWGGAAYTWNYTVPAGYTGAHVANFKGKYHKLGGEGGQLTLLDWSGTATSKGITVTIADVVRAAGLPPSVPPGVTRDVAVVTDPSPLPSGHSITLSIDNGGDAEAGTATVSDPVTGILTQSATIKVLGGTQTTVGHSKKLTIIAKLDGAGPVIARSGGFSVCAHPVNYRLTGFYSHVVILPANALRYGIWVADRWDSDDSTSNADLLDKVMLREDVRLSNPGNPPWQPRNLIVGGWLAGNGKAFQDYSVGTSKDKHFVPADSLPNLPSQAGAKVFAQRHIFYCTRCGMVEGNAVDIASGNFTITADCTLNATQEYQVVTTKEGAGGPLTSLVEPGQAAKAPTAIAVTHAIANGVVKLTITWTDNSSIEDRFDVFYDFSGTTFNRTAAANAVTFTTGGFPLNQVQGIPGTFKVRAHNWRGVSEWDTPTYTIPVP